MLETHSLLIKKRSDVVLEYRSYEPRKSLNEKHPRSQVEALKGIDLWKYPLWQASLPLKTC
jgi:hypothetical protein